MLNISKDIDQIIESFKFVPKDLERRTKLKLEKDRLQAEPYLSQKVIKGNLNLSYNEWITDLGEIEEVHGDLIFHKCVNFTSLGKLKEVHGKLDFWKCKNLTSLGTLQQCKELYLSYSGINYIENKNLRVKFISKNFEYNTSWETIQEFNQWHINKGLADI